MILIFQNDDDYDFSGLEGDNEFFDDDFGLSSKPPPPYPGAGDQPSPRTSGAQPQKPAPEIFVIPHDKKEVDVIVSDALGVFWNLRRCGEPWEAAVAPDQYLMETEVGLVLSFVLFFF